MRGGGKRLQKTMKEQVGDKRGESAFRRQLSSRWEITGGKAPSEDNEGAGGR